jgi:hypothetical protein
MAKSADLSTFLTAYRRLAQAGNQAQLQRMFLLVETKPLATVWRTGVYTTWTALLKGENLCSQAQFTSFELAMTLYRRSVIERIGVDAAVVLARLEGHERAPILKIIESYIAMRDVAPSRQVIWSHVRALRFRPVRPTPQGTAKQRAARH